MSIVELQPGHLPQRLEALGWRNPIRVRGTLADGPAVAIVGARAASIDGMRRAHALGRHLGDRGVHVVSGGALGIDGAAHRGALAGGGTTTVVLGSGLDVVYPDRHDELFRDVVARGGALVSLWADDVAPRRGTFLQRNPLIAALADVVVVVEADVRSGSLSTARAAREQGRIVCAWPGSSGCDHLLSTGAHVVEHVDDLDAALAGTPRRHVAPVADIDPIAARIQAALAAGVNDPEAIARETNLPVRAVVRALARLQ